MANLLVRLFPCVCGHVIAERNGSFEPFATNLADELGWVVDVHVGLEILRSGTLEARNSALDAPGGMLQLLVSTEAMILVKHFPALFANVILLVMAMDAN